MSVSRLFYMSPFGWGVRSLALNEFHSATYSELDAANGGVSTGDSYLRSFGVFTDPVWLWMGPVDLAGVYLLFLAMNAYLLDKLKPITPMGTRKSDTKVSGEHVEGPPEEAAGTSDQSTPQHQRHVVAHHHSNGNAGSHGGAHAHGHKAARHGHGSSAAANGDSLTIQVGPGAGAGKSGHLHSKGLKSTKASFQLTALPFVPVTLAWQNINYSVEVGAGKDKHSRQLLCDISGFAAPGKMTALMGSSGAGKVSTRQLKSKRWACNSASACSS